jgi:pimeloyl-ACP methyl ester carboxylesterase
LSVAQQPPTLLFLPGTLCDERLWQVQQQALSAGWPHTIVNYRFADSIPAMAAQALHENTGLLIPIGLSMGGMVALEVWHQAPERVAALALFDTDCGADTVERRKKRDAQILAAVHGDFRQMVETQLAPNYFSPTHSADVRATTVESLQHTITSMALDLGVAAFAAQITALATRTDYWPLLKTVSVPTLIACGADDQICKPESHRDMASQIKNATFVQIDNAGHLPPLEQPDATTLALRNWLDGLKI